MRLVDWFEIVGFFFLLRLKTAQLFSRKTQKPKKFDKSLSDQKHRVINRKGRRSIKKKNKCFRTREKFF